MNKATLDNIEKRMKVLVWHQIPMEKVSQPIDMVTTMYRLHVLAQYTDALRDGVRVGDAIVGVEQQNRLNIYASLFIVVSASAFECSYGVEEMEARWSFYYNYRRATYNKYYRGRLAGHHRNVRKVIASLIYKGNVGDPNAQSRLNNSPAKDFPNWSALLGMAGKPKFEFWLKPILLDRILCLQDQIKSNLIRAGAYINKKENN